jgi:hypothetical protein
MARRYFWRTPLKEPEWLEDYDTWIMVGNSTRMFNTETKEWFVVSDAPSNPLLALSREGCALWEMTREQWLKGVGRKQGWLRLIGDMIRIRTLFPWWRRRKDIGPPLQPPKITAYYWED